jgi:iron complex transport system substrate-binding protein
MATTHPLRSSHLPARARRRIAALGLIATLGPLAAACDSGAETATREPSVATRTVTHTMGVTEVPLWPQRVVVLDTPELDAALSLGVKPVGAVVTEFGELPSYLEGKVKGIKEVGSIQQPNLEAIAALRPDLILSTRVRHEELYPRLSQIAPTVFGQSPGSSWQQNFPLYAVALGKQEEGEKLFAAYKARAEALGKQLGDPSEITVSVVRFLPGEIRLYSPKSFIGTILSDVGTDRPDIVKDAEEIAVNITLEQLALADGDVIYVSTYGPLEDTQRAEALGGPLWNNLEAVKAGNVHLVEDDVWMLGIGVTGANQVLDQLEKTLPR